MCAEYCKLNMHRNIQRELRKVSSFVDTCTYEGIDDDLSAINITFSGPESFSVCGNGGKKESDWLFLEEGHFFRVLRA